MDIEKLYFLDSIRKFVLIGDRLGGIKEEENGKTKCCVKVWDDSYERCFDFSTKKT